MVPLTGWAQDDNVRVDSQDIKLEEKELISEFTKEADPAVRSYDDKWWSIDIKFSTQEDITEEITVKVYLEAYDYFKEERGENAFVVLTGEVTFINILKGDNHKATFYLHPGSAERYGGSKGAKDFGRANEHNVRVEVLDRGRLVVEMDMNEDPDPNWFRQGSPIPDILIGVEDSPWWPFECRGYNQIKRKR